MDVSQWTWYLKFTMEIVIARKAYFSSGIIFRLPHLSAEESTGLYGEWARSEYGTGFNFCVECFFQGIPDKTSGLVMNLTDIDSILKDVIRPLDHQNLSRTTFKDEVVTFERLALFLFRQVQQELSRVKPSIRLVRLHLQDGTGLKVGVNHTMSNDN